MSVTDKKWINPFSSIIYDEFVFVVRLLEVTYWSFLRDRQNLDDIRGSILEASSPSISNLEGGYGMFLASNSFLRVFPV